MYKVYVFFYITTKCVQIHISGITTFIFQQPSRSTIRILALTGLPHCTEHRPADLRFPGSKSSQGQVPWLWAQSLLGGMQEAVD